MSLYRRPAASARALAPPGDPGQTDAGRLDTILRRAFQHDTVDHLGGFWKLVRRGTGQRFRELDLGSIDPFGEGDGAEQHIAGLGLAPGDALKYVYDFGDWIEHRLTLEEVAEPEAGARYPRIVAQNQPQYQYCQACQGTGGTTEGQALLEHPNGMLQALFGEVYLAEEVVELMGRGKSVEG